MTPCTANPGPCVLLQTPSHSWICAYPAHTRSACSSQPRPAAHDLLFHAPRLLRLQVVGSFIFSAFKEEDAKPASKED